MRLVDSCVWIEYLRGRGFAKLEETIVSGGAAICGTVLAEVLSGVRGDDERRLLERRLCALPYLVETREVFSLAADLYATLRRKGVTVPLSDCVIAAVCIQHEVELLTIDGHFDAFENPMLKPMEP